MVIEILGAILFVITFAVLSRACGGGWPKLPWGLDQHIYALPYAFLGWFLLDNADLYWGWVAGGTFLSYATAFLAKRTGHGQYMALPYSFKAITAERLDPIVKLFFGRDPRVVPVNFNLEQLQRNIDSYGEDKLMKRNLTGLFVTGMGVGLGAAISAIVAGYPLIAGLLVASAGCKALAYYLGMKLTKDVNKRTAIGEFLTGLFAAIGLALAALLVKKKDK